MHPVEDRFSPNAYFWKVKREIWNYNIILLNNFQIVSIKRNAYLKELGSKGFFKICKWTINSKYLILLFIGIRKIDLTFSDLIEPKTLISLVVWIQTLQNKWVGMKKWLSSYYSN